MSDGEWGDPADWERAWQFPDDVQRAIQALNNLERDPDAEAVELAREALASLRDGIMAVRATRPHGIRLRDTLAGALRDQTELKNKTIADLAGINDSQLSHRTRAIGSRPRRNTNRQ